MAENFDSQLVSPLPSSIPCWVMSNPRASKMKGKASTALKQAFSFIAAVVKVKSMVAKSKSSAIKARLLIFGLSKAIVPYNNAVEAPEYTRRLESLEIEDAEDEDDDDYPDLRHSLFDSEEDDDDELANGTGSVIDLVRNSREDGTEFRLEDEIDHVADVYIKRFHRQMKIQKQESFKRYREMLARGV